MKHAYLIYLHTARQVWNASSNKFIQISQPIQRDVACSFPKAQTLQIDSQTDFTQVEMFNTDHGQWVAASTASTLNTGDPTFFWRTSLPWVATHILVGVNPHVFW